MRINSKKEITIINLFKELDDADKDRVIAYCKKLYTPDVSKEEARSVQDEIEEKYDPDHILDEFLFKPEISDTSKGLTEEEKDLIAGYRKLDAYTKRKIRAQVYREVDDMEWINGIIIKSYQTIKEKSKKKHDKFVEKESEKEIRKRSKEFHEDK